MNNGFTSIVMTLKRRSNHPNGWIKRPQDPKHFAKFDRMSRWCWQFFWCYECCSPRVPSSRLHSTKFTTLKYWHVWGTPSDAKNQNWGEVTTGSFITTTLQPTQHLALVSLWPNTRWLFFPTPHSATHLTLLLVTFLVLKT